MAQMLFIFHNMNGIIWVNIQFAFEFDKHAHFKVDNIQMQMNIFVRLHFNFIYDSIIAVHIMKNKKH